MNHPVQPEPPGRPPRPLPVTIVAGQPVVEISDALPATVVGFTQAYCIYRLTHTATLSVAPWRNVALGNICPAEPLLPADVTESLPIRTSCPACLLLRECSHACPVFGIVTSTLHACCSRNSCGTASLYGVSHRRRW